MPQIREYTRKVSEPGPIDQRRLTGADFGGGLAQGMNALGQGLGNYAEGLQKRDEQAEVSDLTAKFSVKHAEFTNRWREAITKADPAKGKELAEKFMTSFDEETGKLEENISTNAGRLFFAETQARLKGHFMESANAGLDLLAGEKAKQDYVVGMHSLTSSLLADPSSFSIALEMSEKGLSTLPAEAALRARPESRQKLAEAAAIGMIRLNPEYAKKQIEGGKFDAFMGGDKKAQMIGEADQAIRGLEAEKERKKKAEEDALKAKREETKVQFITDMTENKLTIPTILRSNLDSAEREHFINLLKAKNSEKLKTDPVKFRHAFEDIHSGKITDERQLGQGVIDGWLDFDDYKHLLAEFQGLNTREGRIAGDQRDTLMKAAWADLAKPNAIGIPDPAGAQNYAKFQSFIFQEEQRLRKEGKPLSDLYDAGSKDYLGRHLTRFRKSPEQIIQEMTESLDPKKERKEAPMPEPVTGEKRKYNGKTLQFKGGKNVKENWVEVSE